MIKYKNYLFEYLFFFIGSFFAFLLNLNLGFEDINSLGLFNKTYAIFIIFSHFFLFSIHENIIKNLPIEYNRDKYLFSIFIITITSSLISVPFFFTINFFLQDYPLFDKINLSSLAFAISIFVINKSLFAILNADKKYTLYFFLNNLRPVLIFFLVFYLYSNNKNITNSFVYTEIIILIINLIIFKKFNIHLKFKNINFYYLKKIFFFNIAAFPHTTLSYSFLRIDIITLSFFVDTQKLGYYSFAAMLIEGIYQLLTMMRDRANPNLSKILHEQKLKINKFSKSVRTNVLLFLAIFSVINYLFFPIINLIVEENFEVSQNLFIIISLGLFVFSIASTFEHIFIMNNKPGIQSIFILSANVINIVLNILLINYFGVYGAAYATAIVFFIMSIVIIIYVFYLYKKDI